MLLLYCDWLNQWLDHDDLDARRYDIHDFTITDPDKGLYGQTQLQGIITGAGQSTINPRFIVSLACSNGDEGGDTELTAWFEVHEDNTTEIVAMIQGFDTNLSMIYEDRKFRNTPATTPPPEPNLN
jgi:hypothetical protein